MHLVLKVLNKVSCCVVYCNISSMHFQICDSDQHQFVFVLVLMSAVTCA